MSKRSDQEFIADCLEATRRAIAYTQNIDYANFLIDNKTQDALIRTLEILGEASKNISPDLKARFPELPWKNMANLRDKLIHHYFGVNLDIVWQVATVELPLLLPKIEAILLELRIN
ncbi:MAG: DUF86 domain-containing protein [Cyanobacteriota bacterium]|jgi:uncharacterized protein with HEPN domain